jgi:CheY-like chemotaxis protein
MVEDNKDLRIVTLKQLTISATHAGGGERQSGAPDLAAHPEIDLLFTDIVMPGGMSGTELAREAKRLYPSSRSC